MCIRDSYDTETNPTFTFSNEASGTGNSFTQDGNTATATFSTYVGTVQPGMGVSGTNIPSGTVVSYVVVDPTTDAITVHVTLPSSASLSTPGDPITFKEFYNETLNSGSGGYQATSHTITLPDTGRLSITRSYNPVTATKYYRYFIRAVSTADLSSTFSGNAVLDSSNDFALCEVVQYKKPTININAVSTLVDNQSPGVAINIRNLDDTVSVSSASANSKTITLASGNTEIKVGMLVTGTNILAKTRVKSISGTTLTIDQTPTSAPTGELKFLDNGQYEAYGEPDFGSVYLSLIHI